jgi:YVTN family beta-propeller protein
MVIGLVACLLILAASPSKGLTRDFFRGAKSGRLVVYIEEPEMVTVDVTVALDSVSAVDDRGRKVPFITQPRLLESRAMAGRQVLLGDASLPEGQYQGLHFSFKEAFIRRGPRKSDLAYPKEGWTLEAPFEVAFRESATLFLHWDPARSMELGFFFSPYLKTERETRQLRQLLVYVSNEGSGTVSVINRHTGRVVATLAVPHGPTGMATSPDNNSLYVVSTKASRITSFKTVTNRLLNEHRFQFGSVMPGASASCRRWMWEKALRV